MPTSTLMWGEAPPLCTPPFMPPSWAHCLPFLPPPLPLEVDPLNIARESASENAVSSKGRRTIRYIITYCTRTSLIISSELQSAMSAISVNMPSELQTKKQQTITRYKRTANLSCISTGPFYSSELSDSSTKSVCVGSFNLLMTFYNILPLFPQIDDWRVGDK